MGIVELVTLAITLIPKIEVGVEEIIKFVQKTRAAWQQTGEWTPELEAAFRQALLDSGRDPASMTDADLAGDTGP